MSIATGRKNIVATLVGNSGDRGSDHPKGHTHVFISDSQQFAPGTKGYATPRQGNKMWFSAEEPEGPGTTIHKSDVRKIKK
jgi:hypothetical protein